MPLMTRWAETHKPAAPVHVHLLLAGVMWSSVGCVLMALGVHWSGPFDPALTPWLLVAGLAVGLAKSRLVMDRAARRIIGRIRARGDGRCLGGFVSPLTWVLILAMMGLGRLLRARLLPPAVIGVVYVAVGSALLVSSRLMWQAWRGARSRSGSNGETGES
jgi:hypothetical protein